MKKMRDHISFAKFSSSGQNSSGKPKKVFNIISTGPRMKEESTQKVIPRKSDTINGDFYEEDQNTFGG